MYKITFKIKILKDEPHFLHIDFNKIDSKIHNFDTNFKLKENIAGVKNIPHECLFKFLPWAGIISFYNG